MDKVTEEYTTASIGTNSYLEEPTMMFRWRKQVLDGKDLEQAWRQFSRDTSCLVWKVVPTVGWNVHTLE